MAYKNNGTNIIGNNSDQSFGNVIISPGHFLEINSSDVFQGTVAGYLAGGRTAAQTNITTIQKFSFATDASATTVGNTTRGLYTAGGQSSSTHGYISGGGPTLSNIIEKFPFSVDTNASDVGDLITVRGSVGSQSSSTHGYVSGGSPSPAPINSIDKFPFSEDSNATDVGDLSQARSSASGQSSTLHGYNSGGFVSLPAADNPSNVIDKFPFSSDTNATDVGDLSQARTAATGQSSTTHGYVSGGDIPSPNTPPTVNTIEKFPFATDTNATDIADLTQARSAASGQSSTVSGYTSGGNDAPGSPVTRTNVIDKFPFASDSNATDVGDLVVAVGNLQGMGIQD